MKIAFFGSPHFAGKILENINGRFPVAFVISQNAKPAGRGKKLTPTPVFQKAIQLKIPCFTYNDLLNFKTFDFDIGIVVAFGKILPKQLLEKARFGFFNLHYSLLPKYRGASPVQFAILNGESETGATIIKLDEKMDHGPIYRRIKQTILPTATAGELVEILTDISIPPIMSLISYVKTENKLPELSAQKENEASYTKILTKNDGLVPFAALKKIINNAPVTLEEFPPFIKEQLRSGNLTMKSGRAGQFNRLSLHNFIRALNPWPAAWTVLPNGKRLKIYRSHLENENIFLDAVQLEGRNISSDLKFINSLIK